MRCSSVLTTETAEATRNIYRRSRTLRLQATVWVAWGWVERLWRGLPIRRWWQLPETSLPYRSIWLAGFLAILPPLGSLYNRQYGKAVVWGVLFWGYAGLCLATLTAPWSNVLLLGLVLMWVTILTDSVVTATRIDGGPWHQRDSVALWFAMLTYVGAAVTASRYLLPLAVFLGAWLIAGVWDHYWQMLGKAASVRRLLLVGILALGGIAALASLPGAGQVYALVRVTSDLGTQELEPGDLVLVSHCSYWKRPPAIGDVVYYDPPRFTYARPYGAGEHLYVINIRNYFQRLSAAGGDELVKTSATLLRNGASLPADRQPFGAAQLPDRRYVVPPDRYFLPVVTIPVDLVQQLSVPPSTFAGNAWMNAEWYEAAMVPREAIMGKAIAIVDPPARRRWLGAR